MLVDGIDRGDAPGGRDDHGQGVTAIAGDVLVHRLGEGPGLLGGDLLQIDVRGGVDAERLDIPIALRQATVDLVLHQAGLLGEAAFRTLVDVIGEVEQDAHRHQQRHRAEEDGEQDDLGAQGHGVALGVVVMAARALTTRLASRRMLTLPWCLPIARTKPASTDMP